MRSSRVTIGMPVYNRGHVVGTSIQQILCQTFADFELLVFDDGSDDGSVEVVRSFHDQRLRLLGSRRYGPPGPLNEILKHAQGEYIIILHDHDLFAPTLLERSVAVLDRNPGAGFVLQGSATVGGDGSSNYREMLLDWPEQQRGFDAGSKMLRNAKNFASPFHACSMVRATALDKAGRYYNPSFGLHADLDLWLRLLRRFDFCYIPDVLLTFREREMVGHFLQGRNMEVLAVVRLLFLKNAAAYFADDPAALNEALENAREAYRSLEIRNTIRSLVRKEQKWKENLNRLANNPMQNVSVRALARLLRLTSWTEAYRGID